MQLIDAKHCSPWVAVILNASVWRHDHVQTADLIAMQSDSSIQLDYNILFYRPSSPWPLHSGGAVHSFNMMRCLSGLGIRVTLLTDNEAPTALREVLPNVEYHSLKSCGESGGASVVDSCPPTKLTSLQKRFARYWGIRDITRSKFAGFVTKLSPDATVCVGPVGPIMLASVPRQAGEKSHVRVWYAADDLALLHLTLARRDNRFGNLKQAFAMALYERAFRKTVDVSWVVSEQDSTALRWLGGATCVSIVRNGVDLDYFHPPTSVNGGQVNADAYSCVFWGALDFAPNRDAVIWFVRNAWPLIRQQNDSAKFRILGLRPPSEVQQLDGQDGITVYANVPDLRPEIARSQVAVFPFISGAGIKNKVLESSALGMPSIGSDQAFNGLVPQGQVPMIRANTPADWNQTLNRLWAEEAARRENAKLLREWVTAHHSWSAAAEAGLTSLQQPQTSDFKAITS